MKEEIMSVCSPLDRREFLGGAVAACATSALSLSHAAESTPASTAGPLDFPLIDYHVHLDNSTLAQVLPLAAERGVRFGVVEHAGTKENHYPKVLSNDDELLAFIKMLEGKGVYKGVQAEWTDWMSCFSPDVLARLDYVLTDAMTFPGKSGERVKLWEQGALDRIGMKNHGAFMDRYVDWHVEIMATEPFDILANTSWLPDELAGEYGALWTERRIQKVLDAALRYGIAIEISSSYKLPKTGFLKQAQAAGVKFSFGSNGRYPNMGKLDYCVAIARELGLKSTSLFAPASDGKKAVQRRKRSA
jgi:histidinol phosphatase-like PHP family hydrolase